MPQAPPAPAPDNAREHLVVLACDLAELAHLTISHSWASKYHWRRVRGGAAAVSDRHWARLLARLVDAGIPHRSRLRLDEEVRGGNNAPSRVREVAVDFGPADVDEVVAAARGRRKEATLVGSRGAL